jgi:hypothetical protein
MTIQESLLLQEYKKSIRRDDDERTIFKAKGESQLIMDKVFIDYNDSERISVQRFLVVLRSVRSSWSPGT